jgi:hypothetical protein
MKVAPAVVSANRYPCSHSFAGRIFRSDRDRLTGQSEKICCTSANPRVHWVYPGWNDDSKFCPLTFPSFKTRGFIAILGQNASNDNNSHIAMHLSWEHWIPAHLRIVFLIIFTKFNISIWRAVLYPLSQTHCSGRDVLDRQRADAGPMTLEIRLLDLI